jgi:putative SOS response-associated peptidase YedK
MCGRYELIDGQRVFMRFGISNNATPILDNVDVRPTQQIPVVHTDHVLSFMKWGLVPSWAKDPQIGSKMINARAEGIESKSAFKRPLRFQRCLIPASAFFEWKGTPGAKVKYRIARKDGDLFGFAGLYDTWNVPNGGGELATCTIITTQPNEVVAPIHNRMPVMLLPEDEERWLDPDMTEPEAIVSLLRPYPADLLMASRAA